MTSGLHGIASIKYHKPCSLPFTSSHGLKPFTESNATSVDHTRHLNAGHCWCKPTQIQNNTHHLVRRLSNAYSSKSKSILPPSSSTLLNSALLLILMIGGSRFDTLSRVDKPLRQMALSSAASVSFEDNVTSRKISVFPVQAASKLGTLF